jgi:hypothetical protein
MRKPSDEPSSEAPSERLILSEEHSELYPLAARRLSAAERIDVDHYHYDHICVKYIHPPKLVA